MPIVPKWGPYVLWPALVIKTHTRGDTSVCGWVCVCDTLTLCSSQCACMNHCCMCLCMSDYMPVSAYAGLSVCFSERLSVCVPAATVGCGGWNVCFSAGPVRPLLLNICPQHINSPTLRHPSLPRDHLIEIHNDSFFSSLPHWAKWSREIYSRWKGYLYQLLLSNHSTGAHKDMVVR